MIRVAMIISMQSFTHSLQMATLVAPTIIFVTSFRDLEQKEQTKDSSVTLPTIF